MLNAVKSFVNDIDIDSGKIQIGLLTYNTGTYVQFHLQRYKTKSEILQAIDRVEYKIGSTNTADAITVAIGCLVADMERERMPITLK